MEKRGRASLYESWIGLSVPFSREIFSIRFLSSVTQIPADISSYKRTQLDFPRPELCCQIARADLTEPVVGLSKNADDKPESQ